MRLIALRTCETMASAGNGASRGELLEQTVPVLTVLPHTLSHPLKASSLHPPPPPPPTPPAHNGPIESLHLSSITCLKPNPSLYPLFSFFPFVFFLPPFLLVTPPLHHLTPFPSRVSYHGHGKCLASVCVSVWVFARRQTVRGKVSLEPAGRHTRGATGRDQILIDEHARSLSLAGCRGRALNSALSLSHSCARQSVVGVGVGACLLISSFPLQPA